MLKNYSKKIQDLLLKHDINAGDKIEIKGKEEKFEGYLIPQTELGDPDIIILKISSGYNVGIRLKEVFEIKKLKDTRKLESFTAKKLKINKKLPNISILHTGGTIASRLDYRTGGVVSAFSPEELIMLFPELEEIINIKARVITNLWSEDIRIGHYQLMANEIAEEIESGADGIILGHGTDTLHYTAAALDFIFSNLPIPILIVGAQRSSDRGSSDAGSNLISAARFIINTDFSGIAVCMHGTSNDTEIFINPPCKTRKMHTSRRDAFRPINVLPIAKLNYLKNEIEFIKKDYLRKDKNRKFEIKSNFEEKVGLIKIYPDFDANLIKYFIDNEYKGLIVEGTGLGHVPGVRDDISKKNEKIMEYLGILAKKAIVIMTSQCLYGRINMNVYDKGRDLQNVGIIPGEDMLPEIALIKLKWLLGNYSIEEARSKARINLKGEIDNQGEIKSYLF
ncbi:MAG: Glu-tRNA(Gln) amidotransferase GatDE subunit D [Candidatus Lokiarchaeota archaeon]|nr:Glu-tRNA(Gln) amidotransferase GatDE subunit D [Candidatus Lokiarchaeota archaeon]